MKAPGSFGDTCHCIKSTKLRSSYAPKLKSSNWSACVDKLLNLGTHPNTSEFVEFCKNTKICRPGKSRLDSHVQEKSCTPSSTGYRLMLTLNKKPCPSDWNITLPVTFLTATTVSIWDTWRQFICETLYDMMKRPFLSPIHLLGDHECLESIFYSTCPDFWLIWMPTSCTVNKPDSMFFTKLILTLGKVWMTTGN